jgi:hypothetical protein
MIARAPSCSVSFVGNVKLPAAPAAPMESIKKTSGLAGQFARNAPNDRVLSLCGYSTSSAMLEKGAKEPLKALS